MSAAVPIPVIQLLQVLTVALGAPGVTGVIAKVEARLQGRRGPRVLQPYCDLAKLFRKEALAPRASELVLPGRAVDRGHVLPDHPAADSRADQLRAAAGLHGRH